MDKVRVPVVLVPYEDMSSQYQKQLKKQQRAGTSISEPAALEDSAVKAVSEAEVDKDSLSQASEAFTSAAEETAEGTQTSEIATAPPSESPKKD